MEPEIVPPTVTSQSFRVSVVPTIDGVEHPAAVVTVSLVAEMPEATMDAAQRLGYGY